MRSIRFVLLCGTAPSICPTPQDVISNLTSVQNLKHSILCTLFWLQPSGCYWIRISVSGYRKIVCGCHLSGQSAVLFPWMYCKWFLVALIEAWCVVEMVSFGKRMSFGTGFELRNMYQREGIPEREWHSQKGVCARLCARKCWTEGLIPLKWIHVLVS